MADVLLTSHQHAALDWLVERLSDGVSLVALRGLAGTGKTTLIPTLRRCLEALGIPVAVGSPTHRAAMVLKRKGIADADTIHAHALTPSFLPDYAKAMFWLGEEVPSKEIDKQGNPFPAHDDVDGVPWLIHERLGDDVAARRDVRRRAGFYGAKKALESLGIYGREHFAGFGPKIGEGCLIIDEASMVGEEQLALCQQAFPLVCLIGDPGQLPPVKDRARLAEVDGFDLTEIHRQAADSPILQLAYKAREGEPFWQQIPTQAGLLEEWMSVPAEAFLESPLIVWRNKTRLECTHAIRAQLGYPVDEVRIGEPLVCRSTDQKDRADGFYNNALFRIVELSGHDPRKVTVQEDCSEKTHDVYLHLEELHGDRIDPKAIPFRFGYCLTAHTAQGGEWPTVYISKPDMLAQAGFSQRDPDRTGDFACWSYTAITRAKQTLGFLNVHTFDRACQAAVPHLWEVQPSMATPPQPRPPSAPMMGTTPQPEPDDIPDPPTPPDVLSAATAPSEQPTVPPVFAEHQALLHGFCQALQQRILTDVLEQSKGVLRVIDAVYERTTSAVAKLAEQNEHAQYTLGDALSKLQTQGIMVMQNPYKITVHVITPQGFPLALEVAKSDAGTLMESMQALLLWLKEQGYQVPEGVTV